MSSTASARSGTAAIRASPLCWNPATATPSPSPPATASRASPSRPSRPASMATRSNRPPGSRYARPASSKSPTRMCEPFFAASRPATQPSTKKPSACSTFDLKPLPSPRDLLERPIDIREHLAPHPLVPVHTLEGFLEVLDLHDSERALVAVRRHPMVADRRHLRRRPPTATTASRPERHQRALPCFHPRTRAPGPPRWPAPPSSLLSSALHEKGRVDPEIADDGVPDLLDRRVEDALRRDAGIEPPAGDHFPLELPGPPAGVAEAETVRSGVAGEQRAQRVGGDGKVDVVLQVHRIGHFRATMHEEASF